MQRSGVHDGVAVTADIQTAALYAGRVMHRRHGASAHAFEYRVFSLLADLDALPELDRGLRWFSHNRFNLLSFHDRDHGPRDGSALRPWLLALLARHGVDGAGRRLRLLSFPRVLGYVFNPISLWLVDRPAADAGLEAIVCQVHNTFGDQHCYLLHGGGMPLNQVVRAQGGKRMHVSPFIALAGDYRFRFDMAAERFDYTVEQREDGRPLLVARHWATANAMDDATILRLWCRHPLLTLKVIGGIHWEALRLFLRGTPFHARPAPPQEEVTQCTLI